MTIYDRAQASALRMLTKYGQTVTLRSHTDSIYDPATGQNVSTVTDTYRKGVKLGFGANQTSIRGQLIQVEDARLLLDPSGDSPLPQDIIVLQGIEYTIVSIDDTNPGGINCLFDLHLRVGG